MLRPARQDVQEDRDIVRPEVPERVHVLPDRTEGGADAVDVLDPPQLVAGDQIPDRFDRGVVDEGVADHHHPIAPGGLDAVDLRRRCR